MSHTWDWVRCKAASECKSYTTTVQGMRSGVLQGVRSGGQRWTRRFPPIAPTVSLSEHFREREKKGSQQVSGLCTAVDTRRTMAERAPNITHLPAHVRKEENFGVSPTGLLFQIIKIHRPAARAERTRNKAENLSLFLIFSKSSF